ncbi:MAG TPA: hypothetical protein VFJ58_24450 [Armatimonadota bacterium]|nr:hypothetical protein [Armatimonadota bacterium]
MPHQTQSSTPFAASTPRSAGGFDLGEPIFTYYIRRRDGERPLAMLCAFVAALTLGLTFWSIHRTSDWRPFAFYSVFCLFSVICGTILTMQWRNDRLIAYREGLVHSNWRDRKSFFRWDEVDRVTSKRRPYNYRLILEIGSDQRFVIHADFPNHEEVFAACIDRLAAVGRPLIVDELDDEPDANASVVDPKSV